MTRCILLSILVLTAWSAAAVAQSENGHTAYGYVLVAAGAASPGGAGTVHLGFGGEGLLFKGFAVGADLGYLGPWRRLSNGISLFSANGSYYFRNPRSSAKTVPFVTAGYSLAFRSGTANVLNVGAEFSTGSDTRWVSGWNSATIGAHSVAATPPGGLFQISLLAKSQRQFLQKSAAAFPDQQHDQENAQ